MAKKAAKKAAPKKSSLTVCSGCGLMVEGDAPAWSVSFERGRLTYLCPNCARVNIRAIEAKLPEEYWE